MAAHAKDRNLRNGSIVTAGTADAQTFVSGVSYTIVPTGLRVLLKIGPALTNTGAVTLNMDGIGAVADQDMQGQPLVGGEFIADGYVEFLYNGTNWIWWRRVTAPIPGDLRHQQRLPSHYLPTSMPGRRSAGGHGAGLDQASWPAATGSFEWFTHGSGSTSARNTLAGSIAVATAGWCASGHRRATILLTINGGGVATPSIGISVECGAGFGDDGIVPRDPYRRQHAGLRRCAMTQDRHRLLRNCVSSQPAAVGPGGGPVERLRRWQQAIRDAAIIGLMHLLSRSR